MATINRIVAVLGCSLAFGCSKEISAPRTHPATGTVLVNGKPVAGVKVTFHPKFDMGSVKFAPNGLTDKDGRFKLSTAAVNDGAPKGDYTVTFELMKATSDKNGLDIDVDVWKGKYADVSADRWPATIRSGENDLEPFRLD